MIRMLPAIFLLALLARLQAANAPKVEANKVAEITFEAAKPHPHPFMQVTLDVESTDPAGAKKLVSAFWAGKNQWKVRYASPVARGHPWRSLCNTADDAGLHGITGKVEIAPNTGTNPLYRHGPIRVAQDSRHFEHGDGSVVTCFWYRFADQPAMLNADLTAAEREVVQKRVEKLHRAWTKDRNYLAPPDAGRLAEIDPALIVTPPKGLEAGYVPSATRQEWEKLVTGRTASVGVSLPFARKATGHLLLRPGRCPGKRVLALQWMKSGKEK